MSHTPATTGTKTVSRRQALRAAFGFAVAAAVPGVARIAVAASPVPPTPVLPPPSCDWPMITIKVRTFLTEVICTRETLVETRYDLSRPP